MADDAAFSGNLITRGQRLRETEPLDRVLAHRVDAINGIPLAAVKQTGDAHIRAHELIADASLGAAAISGALALQPKPAGWRTVVSDLAAIWRLQAQMVADVGAVFGKNGRLTEESILYCLFRHATAQVVRELVTATAEKVARRNTQPATEDALQKIGTEVIRRSTLRRSSRWLPVLGALAVAAYAYYDTDQVGQTAIQFFNGEIDVR